MTDFLYLPNRNQKYWLFITILLTLAASAAIGMLAVYAPLTNQNMNWGLLLILILMLVSGIYTTSAIYSASRITVIFREEELQVINAKNNPCIYWNWSDIEYRSTFCDMFGRHYAVLSKDSTPNVDEAYITRNISRVVLSDSLIAFIIQDSRDKDSVFDLLNRKVTTDKRGEI